MFRSAMRHPHRLEVPAGVAVGIVTATVALTVDQLVGLPLTIPAGNARGLLAATFGALVTAGAFSFWMLPLAAQLAAASVPPPTVAGHLEDPFQRRVVAVTLGGLAYTAVTVLSLPAAADAAAPPVATVLAGLLGVVGIAALLVAIQHAVRSTQPSKVVSEAAEDLIARIVDAGSGRDEQPDGSPRVTAEPDDQTVAVLAPRTGWLHTVDEDQLLKDVPEDTIVSLEVGLGAFVVEGWTRVATVCRSELHEPDSLAATLAGRFTVRAARGTDRDLLGSMTRFTDIAIHAGSGGSGAPSIVYESIWYLSAVLHTLVGRDLGQVERRTEDGRVLEWSRQPDASMLANLAVDRIRQTTASDPAMALELVRIVVDAERAATQVGHHGLAEVLDDQADLIVAQCRHADPLPTDLDRVVAARHQIDGDAQGSVREDEFPPTEQDRKPARA